MYDFSRKANRHLFSFGSLYSATLTGHGIRKLAEGSPQVARWSPDGKTVAFTGHDLSGKSCAVVGSIWILAADGSSGPKLAADCASYWVAWSPNSRRLAFFRWRDSKAGALVTLSLDDGRLQEIVRVEYPWDLWWSADAEWIAYTTGYPRDRLHVVNVATGQDRDLGQAGAPAWSPGGQRLAVAERKGLSIVQPGESRRRFLDRLGGTGMSWSPSGRLIACWSTTSARRQARVGLYVVRADGRGQRRLVTLLRKTPAAAQLDLGPIYWSRDGSRIIFERQFAQGE